MITLVLSACHRADGQPCEIITRGTKETSETLQWTMISMRVSIYQDVVSPIEINFKICIINIQPHWKRKKHETPGVCLGETQKNHVQTARTIECQPTNRQKKKNNDPPIALLIAATTMWRRLTKPPFWGRERHTLDGVGRCLGLILFFFHAGLGFWDLTWPFFMCLRRCHGKSIKIWMIYGY